MSRKEGGLALRARLPAAVCLWLAFCSNLLADERAGCSKDEGAAESAAVLERPWTVQDSVAVRYFVRNWNQPGFLDGQDDPVRFSPDGAHFFFVTLSSDLAVDRTVYEMWIYSRQDVEARIRASSAVSCGGVPPLRKVRMESSRPSLAGSAAIYLPKWDSNSTIVFVGTEGGESRRVFRYDIGTGTLIALTEPQYRIGESSGREYAVRGTTTLFETYHRAPSPGASHPVQRVDSEFLFETAGRYGEGDKSATHWRLNASYKGAPARVVAEGEIAHLSGAYRSEPAISPDERWAVVIYRPTGWSAPQSWQQYQFATAPYWFMLLDLQNGGQRPMLDSPTGNASVVLRQPWKAVQSAARGAAFWSADSRRILVLNTALPLDAEKPASRRTSFVVDYDVATGSTHVVDVVSTADRNVRATPTWVEEGRALRVAYEDIQTKERWERFYEFQGRQWKRGRARALTAPPAQNLKVELRQGLDEPPRMFASLGSKEIALTDEDNALRGVWRARPGLIQWTGPGGQPVTSELLRPRTTSPGKLPSLVIQFANTSRHSFFPDGLPGTADAAQPLVAEGYAVLKLTAAGGYGKAVDNELDEQFVTSTREFPAQVEMIDAAVSMLRSRGLVNEEPIGLIGFSRTGTYAYYVATHPGKIEVGAAIAFDSLTNGFGTYLNMAGLLDPRETRHFSLQFGNGKPFWQNKEGWLDASDLNLDRLRTPMLFSTTWNPVIYYAPETIGAFRLAQRPFEFLYYPGAGHGLQSPRQREAALQYTVDWMNFWLRGRERSSLEASAQFARWREIREEWEKVQAQEAAARDGVPRSTDSVSKAPLSGAR